ncbi:MAG: hypothetical protein F6K19_17865 [Cyanothece sp. SIO1E1]|nr:hypothetical protein [Cyanothece sp. SIO1E1]
MVTPIYFYIPPCHWPEEMPAGANEGWAGFGLGIYAWTLQTYLRLQADGFPCHLVSTLPAAGIILAHRNSLQTHNPAFKPGAKQLLICLKAESAPYPFAHLHVVQNPLEAHRLKNSYYLPHWPQPGLIPRDGNRGDRFENIAFVGHATNLAPELQHHSWLQQLNDLGLNWQPLTNQNRWDRYQDMEYHWHDYSTIDAVLAVRSFNHRHLILSQNHLTKPATKLYNAWLAGIPAILGCESAYQAERKSNLDYVEVASLESAIAALKQLRDDQAWRQDMVKHGQTRAQAIKPSRITAQWRKFLETVAIPIYDHWCAQPGWKQELSLSRSYLTSAINRLGHKVRLWPGQ